MMFPIVTYQSRHEELGRLYDRSSVFDHSIQDAVREIIEAVRVRGDAAVFELTVRFDGVRPSAIRVQRDRAAAALEGLDREIRSIIEEAAANIRAFHEKQVRPSWFSEEEDGVVLGQRYVPLDRVGVYVPGGTAAYPSSVLMNVIPAQVAGVREILLASPPGPSGIPHPAVLAAAHLLGIEHVFAMGGAQAVAAFAYGTESVPKVDKIVGPGNAYVAAAKKEVFGRVAIAAIAGPSEIVVLADRSASAEYVAADLLSQAEHDSRASAVLVTTDRRLAEEVQHIAGEMVLKLPRKDVVMESLQGFGAAIVVETLDEAIEAVNELAPEHLEIHTADPGSIIPRIRHAGAIFIGPYSPEPVGDYFAGPNHVLPTGGTARYASALGVEEFVRRQSIVSYTGARL